MEVYLPASHLFDVTLHAVPSSTSEYVEPTTQSPHSLFSVVDPEEVSPCPTGQDDQIVQVSTSVVELLTVALK